MLTLQVPEVEVTDLQVFFISVADLIKLLNVSVQWNPPSSGLLIMTLLDE